MAAAEFVGVSLFSGGRSWHDSLVLNGAQAYSYSCLSEVPQPGFIGLVWETVLPGTVNKRLRKGASANNVVFTLIPQALNRTEDGSATK